MVSIKLACQDGLGKALNRFPFLYRLNVHVSLVLSFTLLTAILALLTHPNWLFLNERLSIGNFQVMLYISQLLAYSETDCFVTQVAFFLPENL